MRTSEYQPGELDGHPRRRAPQRGYLMVGLVVSVAIMMIFSTLAFQAWIDVLRRDNEAEMIFRAQDLVRAIQRYRRDRGGVGPPKLEDLMEPGSKNQYFLRRLWQDPLVLDGKWGLLYAGPGGQLVDPNAPESQTGLEGADSSFGSGGLGQTSGGSVFDQNTQPGTNQPGTTPPGSVVAGSTMGRGAGGDDPNAAGRQLAGLPIAGVKSLCDEKPFRVYNGLSEYREWLFSYFDLEQPKVGGPAGAAQQTRPGFGKRPGAFGERPGFGKPPGSFGDTPGFGKRPGRLRERPGGSQRGGSGS